MPPLTIPSAGSPHRGFRTFARPAIAWLVAAGITLGPWAVGTAGATVTTAAATEASPAGTSPATGPSTPVASVDSLQIQAQELAGEIDADGQTLDQLDASYQAASINYQRLTARQAAMRRAMAATATKVAAARQALKAQALLAYMAGGAPVVQQVPDVPGMDRSLTVAYAEIVTGGQQTAVDDYRATLDAESRQQAALDANSRQMAVTMGTLKAESDQAAAALEAQHQALAQVKGQLVAAVAQVQERQQAAQQAQEEATLTAQGVELPPAGGGSAGSISAAHAGTTSPYTSTPVATAPVATAPVATAPPATRAPATQPAPSRPPATSPPAPGPPPSGGGGGIPAQAAGVARVLAYARAQLGKPYQWAGAGPDSFDCSGLVMRAWEQAGIDFPHLAQDQYDLTARLPLSDLIPGDLVFFGTPDDVYHVGIYVGSGDMIDAPETGQNVQVQSIYWDSLLGGGRVTAGS